MPVVEVLPCLYIKTALTPDSEIPADWSRLCLREGVAPRHPSDVLHLALADDAPWSPEVVSAILEFIDSRLRMGGHVLVECVAGVSRSPSAVVAYIAKRDSVSVEEALDTLRAVYPPADPSARILDSLKRVLGEGG